MANRYIVSNLSMFNYHNKIYIYNDNGESEEIGECNLNDAAEQIAYHCLNNDIEFVQIYGNGLYLRPIAKSIVREVDKQKLNYSNKNLKVKVTIG